MPSKMKGVLGVWSVNEKKMREVFVLMGEWKWKKKENKELKIKERDLYPWSVIEWERMRFFCKITPFF